MKKRLIALLTVGAMVVSLFPMNVLAVEQTKDGICEHHTEHTADCGYRKGTEGTPCNHEHTEDCYSIVTDCIHEHTEECVIEGQENCTHTCSEETGCIINELQCQHEHDADCGYSEGTPKSPCSYQCNICATDKNGEIEEADCICEEACTEKNRNELCEVCGREEADLTDCKGKAEEADCICEEPCTEENRNELCEVCGREEVDLTECKGSLEEGDCICEEPCTEENINEKCEVCNKDFTICEVEKEGSTALFLEEIQKQIDALPTAEVLQSMSVTEQQAVYEALLEAYDAYEEMAEEEKAEITGAEIFEELFAVYHSAVNTLAVETVSIGTADELVAFATEFNKGADSQYSENVNVVLTADIDMDGKDWMIIAHGMEGLGRTYQGVFDGQGYIIENLTFHDTQENSGLPTGVLFGYINNATICNLGVTGEVSGYDILAGGIVGSARGDSKIENCFSDVDISVNLSRPVNIGGIASILDSESVDPDDNIAIKNCYYTGEITVTGGSLDNCNAGSILGGALERNIENCYTLNLYDYNGGRAGTQASAEDFASGKITWALNEKKSDGPWKQTLGAGGDAYPKLQGPNVYKKGDTYSNTPTKYTITVQIDAPDTSGIRVDGGGEYNEGDMARVSTVILDPIVAYHFVKWTENGQEASTSDNYSFTVTENRTLTAVYEPHQNYYEWHANGAAGHYRGCSICGKIMEQRNHDSNAEKKEDAYKKADATCTTGTAYYKSCSVCGWASGETFFDNDQKGHDWQYSTENTATLKAVCQNDSSHTASVTISAPPDLTYNGLQKTASLSDTTDWKNLELTVPTIQYAVNRNNNWEKVDSAIDVGRYQASISAGDVTASVKFEITKASRSIDAPTKKEATPNSITLNEVSPDKGADDGTVEYGWSDTDDSNTVTNWQEGTTFNSLTADKSYYFFARVVDGQNYMDAVSTGMEIKTNAKTVVMIEGITAASSLYDGKSQAGYEGTPTSGAYTGALEYTYYKDSVLESNKLSGEPTNAGYYVLVISVPESDPTYTGSKEIEFTIKKRSLVLEADNKTTVVGQEKPELTYSIKGDGLVEGETLEKEPELLCDADMNQVDNYAITMRGAKASDNYDITYEQGVLEIKDKIPVSITGLTAIDRDYDGTNIVALTGGSLTGAEDGDDVEVTMPVSGTMENANAGNGKTVLIPEIVLSGKDAYKYVLTQPTPTVNINKATLIAAYVDETIKRDKTPALKVAVTGFVNDETAETAAGYEAPIVENTNTAVGSYTLTPTGGTADNYQFQYVSGTLTIRNSNKNPSSGGGSSSKGNIIEHTDKDEISTIAAVEETELVQPDDEGNVTIQSDSVQKAIEKGSSNKKKNITVVVPIENAVNEEGLIITISAETLDRLLDAKVKQFDIRTNGLPCFSLPLDTLDLLHNQSDNGDWIIKIREIAVSSSEAKAAIGDRPVYDISMVCLENGEEIELADWKGNTVSVKIPYTPTKEEQVKNLYAVYVDENGKVEWLSGYDASQKAVIFNTNHFSIYGVGYKVSNTAAPTTPFTDISGHWAEEPILFVTNRGLLSGTGNNQFSPNIGMTRGMFVTALGRLSGVDPSGDNNEKFVDVKGDAYYTPFISWAAQKGIVSGITETTFLPDTDVTREQMAVIMKNYANKMGYDLPKTREETIFTDHTNISPWALEAVQSMQQAGIITGKDGNYFDPQGTATRAEVATLLYRFVEAVIDTSIER